MPGDVVIFLVILALRLSEHEAAAQGFREVVVNSALCPESLHVNEGETIRLLPSTEKTVCGVYDQILDCRLHIDTNHSAEIDKLCVDVSRIQPQGENSTLTVRYYVRGKATYEILTNTHYPYRTKSMSSVVCSESRYLALYFKCGCNGTISSYFPSWLYVYVQTKRTGNIYYLDGQCKHEESLDRYPSVLTVRSYLWHNTFGAPEVQLCSLELATSIYVSFNEHYVFCPVWNFTHGRLPCGTEVAWKRKRLYADPSTAVTVIRASCKRPLDLSHMNRRIEMDSAGSVLIHVLRKKWADDIRRVQHPGQQMFSLTFSLNLETRSPDSSYNDNSYEDIVNTEEMGPLTKLFLGLAACAAFVCCFCSAAHKMTKKQNQQDISTVSLAATGRFASRRDPPPTNQESLLMRHMNSNTTGAEVDHSHPGHISGTLGFSDSDSTGSLDYGASSRSREVSAPPVPVRDANAPPTYEEVAAAPPDVPPPPSYKDLFPSRD